MALDFCRGRLALANVNVYIEPTRLAGGGKMAPRIRDKLTRGPKLVSENMAVTPKGLQQTSAWSSCFLYTGNDEVK